MRDYSIYWVQHTRLSFSVSILDIYATHVQICVGIYINSIFLDTYIYICIIVPDSVLISVTKNTKELVNDVII